MANLNHVDVCHGNTKKSCQPATTNDSPVGEVGKWRHTNVNYSSITSSKRELKLQQSDRFKMT